MSKEKKAAEIKEEIKEEIKDSAQLTDEQMAEVNAGMAEIDERLERVAFQVELQPSEQLADRMAAHAGLASNS